MAAIETLFIDGINTIFTPILNGTTSAINVSIDALGKIYGEQFLQDLIIQLEHINLDFINDLEKLRLEAINFKVDLTVGLENLSLEINELALDLDVKGLEAVQPPSFGTIKFVESISLYILAICALISGIILFDAYKIYTVRNEFEFRSSSKYTRNDMIKTLQRV